MSGYGRFIFPEGGWEFRGTFARGLPQTGMLLPPRGQCRRFVECFKRVPIWEIQPEQLVLEDMVEVPTPPFLWARADCLALVHVVTSSDGTKTHNFKHLKRVTARLVWARPMHAEMPLWNASECRGKIVAIMQCQKRPTTASKETYYSVCYYHACPTQARSFVQFMSFASLEAVGECATPCPQALSFETPPSLVVRT